MSDKHRNICWQGWKLQLPRRWDPLKLEGDHAQGYALFADTLRPRLGLRWQTPRRNRKFDPDSAVRLALRNEVGQLAAEEAKTISVTDDTITGALLYIEPQPPGRDVLSLYSERSNRLLQLAYHAHRREQILARSILPTLADFPLDRAAPWAIFDLSCIIPANMHLKSQRLSAGDLGLTFADQFNQITVRQIAIATLALERQSLDGWIADQQKAFGRYHQPAGIFSDVTLPGNNHELTGRTSQMQRRMRYSLLWSQPKTLITIALHDPARDRLILLHGSDESLMKQIAITVGTICAS